MYIENKLNAWKFDYLGKFETKINKKFWGLIRSLDELVSQTIINLKISCKAVGQAKISLAPKSDSVEVPLMVWYWFTFIINF
jgi:hypothetical protein